MRTIAMAIAIVALSAACASETAPQASSPDPTTAPVTGNPALLVEGEPYAPSIDPADFTTDIDNPYLPYEPGSKWTYEAETEDGTETIEVEVLEDTKTVAMGVEVVIVHDTVSIDGELLEDTFDWYAQDSAGNVWYFGEDTHEYEDGKPINSAGAWEAGVDGAQPGIVMPAEPKVGELYRQEFYEGEAEDTGEVIKLGESVEVPAGTYTDVVVTEDLNPSEPDVVENKYYAPGVGVVLELKVKGGDERTELVAFTPGS